MKRKVYSDIEIVTALTLTKGSVIAAAQALGCSPVTIYNRARGNPDIGDRVVDQRRTAASRPKGKETRDRILEFILSWSDRHGFPPTLREIVEGAGLSSVSVAHYHLRHLERDGKIARRDGLARGIVVLEAESDKTPTADVLSLCDVIKSQLSNEQINELVVLLGGVREAA